MQAGVVGLEVGKTHIHKTRFGYSISIDPKMDPDGKILEHLGHCKTEEHYNLFLTVHKGKVKVLGKSKGRTDAESTQIGVSIGNQKLELGTNQSVDKDVTVDAQGKVVSKKTVGRAGAGGKLGKRGDSVADEAVAETDVKGNTTVTLTTTTTKTKGDKEKKDLSGLGLSDADLIRLGGSAVRSLPFWNDQYRRTDEKQDWKKAGLAIVAGKGSASAVGHALAEFVGGDRVERMKTVMHLLRGGYKQTAGKAFEFPDSLRDIRDDYDLVIDDKLADKMNAYANKKGDPAAAKECQRLLAIVDRLFPRVNGCKDFKDGTIKTEMMGPEQLPHGAEPGRPRVQRQPQAAGRSQGARRGRRPVDEAVRGVRRRAGRPGRQAGRSVHGQGARARRGQETGQAAREPAGPLGQ